jgi:tetratricopeptide (TPR) repeat protein
VPHSQSTEPAHPAVVEYLIRRAGELNHRGAHALALEAADLAIQTDPHSTDAYVARGWALEQLGLPRLPEACAAYQRALALDPECLGATSGLATVLDRLGQREEARSLYRSVVERLGDVPDADADTLEITGWCAFKIGRLDQARLKFEQALALDPTIAAVRFDLALTLLAAGEDEPALAHYRRGLAGPDASEVAAHAAVALQDLLDDAGERACSPEAVESVTRLLSEFVAHHSASR